jgi:hypothetical protein
METLVYNIRHGTVVLALPVPKSWLDIGRHASEANLSAISRDRKSDFELYAVDARSGDNVTARIASLADVLDLALMEQTAKTMHDKGLRISEKVIVEVSNRPAIKLAMEENDRRYLMYILEVGESSAARILYAVDRETFPELRSVIEQIETPSNRYASVLTSRRLRPPGHLELGPLTVPGHWAVIGQAGDVRPLRNVQGQVAEVTIVGAAVLADPTSKQRDGARYTQSLMVRMIGSGKIDERFAEAILAGDQPQFRSKPSGILENKAVLLRVSDRPCQKIVAEYRLGPSQPYVALFYFVSDELDHNWQISFCFSAEQFGVWRNFVEGVELKTAGNAP